MNVPKQKLPIADCRLPIIRPNPAVRLHSPHASRLTPHAFTLIELLVVISIIGVLAAFSIPALGKLKARQNINTASAELEQIKAALADYHAKYGVYPPGNPGLPTTNQLYYELSGTTHDANAKTYTVLDGSSTISETGITNAFKAGGLVNSTAGVGGEDDVHAKNFLPSRSSKLVGTFTVNGVNVSNLVTSVRGPDTAYQPLGVPDMNPFRYRYPGTNNPSSYDLWVQLVISGKTNLICNWNKQVQINCPLP